MLLTLLRIVRKLRIDRMPRLVASTHPFTEYFRGYEKIGAVKRLFGKRTQEVLKNLKIELTWIPGYMWVSNADGHIIVNSRYLNNGDRVDIHLDVIHELAHVKQFMDGKELFDTTHGYTERPTEIEAYRYAVEEARNMGLSDQRICQYLKTEWMSNNDLTRLAKSLNINCTEPEET